MAACVSSSLSFSLLLLSFGFSVDFSAVSACGGVTSWMSVVSFECVTLISGLLSLLLKCFWCIWSTCSFQSCSPTRTLQETGPGCSVAEPLSHFGSPRKFCTRTSSPKGEFSSFTNLTVSGFLIRLPDPSACQILSDRGQDALTSFLIDDFGTTRLVFGP